MSNPELIHLEDASDEQIVQLVAEGNAQDVSEAVSEYYRRYDEMKSRYEEAESRRQLAIDKGLQQRLPTEYASITKAIPCYKAILIRARTVRTPVQRLAEYLGPANAGTLSHEDLQHPWLQHCAETSGSYCKGMLACIRSMDELHYNWSQTTLYICLALARNLRTAWTWTGPHEKDFAAAARSIRSGRHVPSVHEIVGLIPAAEQNFSAKSVSKKGKERLRYHRFFRLATIPGGSFILLSYCDYDKLAKRLPLLDQALNLPLSATTSWRGAKQTSKTPFPMPTPSPGPAPSPPGHVEEVEPSEAGERQQSPTPTPTPAPARTWIGWLQPWHGA